MQVKVKTTTPLTTILFLNTFFSKFETGAVVAAGTGNFADDPALKCYMKCIGVELATVSWDFQLIDLIEFLI